MKKITLNRINKSFSALTIAALALGTFGMSLATAVPFAAADTVAVTTNPATSITASDATLNATNGASDASGHSFWVSTSTFSTAVPVLPTGVYSTADLGAVASSTNFSALLSSVTGISPVTPNTTYYYAAWSNVGGTWTPGAVVSFTTVSAPTISMVAPATGTTLGGTSFTITGTGFNPGAAVTIGAVAATGITVVDSTSITATTPAGTAGAHDVVVTNTDAGTATATDGFTYVTPVVSTAVTTLPATTITSSNATLNALNGATAASGSSFWVSTSTFSTAAPVLPTGVYSTADLGAVAASTPFSAALSSVSGLPVVTASTTYFYAAWTNVGGTWMPGAVLQFTTAASAIPTFPVVSSLSTSTGAIAGGTSVTITGTGLSGATSVHFGGVAGIITATTSDTSIIVTSPATTTTGVVDVTVTTPLGTSATSTNDQFTYTLTGTVIGSGVLHVDSIESTKASATADGTFTNGWIYTFNVTVPTDETHVSMQFANWLSGANIIPVGGNMQISSAQANNAGAEVPLTAANTYSSPTLNMTGDLSAVTPGLQVQIVVDVAVPTGTPNGAYSTNYSVQSI